MIAKCPYCNAEMEGDATVGDFVECPICNATFTIERKHVVPEKVNPKVVRTVRRERRTETYRPPPSGVDKYMPSEKPSRHHEHLPALLVVILIIGTIGFFAWKAKQSGKNDLGNATTSFPGERTASSGQFQKYDPLLGLMVPQLRSLAAYSFDAAEINSLYLDDLAQSVKRNPLIPPHQKLGVCQRLRDKGIVRPASGERMLFHAIPDGVVFCVEEITVPSSPKGTIRMNLELVNEADFDLDGNMNSKDTLWKKQSENWLKVLREFYSPGLSFSYDMFIRRSPKVDREIEKLNAELEDNDIFVVSKNWIVGLRVSEKGGEPRRNWLFSEYELYPSEEEAMALMGMRSSPPFVKFQTMKPPEY